MDVLTFLRTHVVLIGILMTLALTVEVAISVIPIFLPEVKHGNHFKPSLSQGQKMVLSLPLGKKASFKIYSRQPFSMTIAGKNFSSKEYNHSTHLLSGETETSGVWLVSGNYYPVEIELVMNGYATLTKYSSLGQKVAAVIFCFAMASVAIFFWLLALSIQI